MKIVTILGTRPEITKLSPLLHLLDEDEEIEHILIHTGQHYDYNMDSIFFSELGLKSPKHLLEVGSGSHANQVAKMMEGIEDVLNIEKPDGVIVFADPNTPLAGSLVASKMHIPLVHLEAGCRSFNKKMPEEINRIVCDHCADLLLAPDKKAHQNLLREGLPEDKISVVGSTAVEASLRNIVFAREKSKILKELDMVDKDYILLTIHRAENTNNFLVLKGLIEAAEEIAYSENIPIIFPIHPRTKKILIEHNFIPKTIKLIEPQGYLDFLNLLDSCLFVMSDSGGIQEEAVALDTPCLILRNETEWTYFTDVGKNLLLGTNKEKIIEVVTKLLRNKEKLQHMKNIQLNLNSNVAQKMVEIIKNGIKR